MVKELNRHFSKEDIHMANMFRKKMLNTTNHKNQNHNEISSSPIFNDYYKKDTMNQNITLNLIRMHK
jgi:hypothetical protein